MDINWSVEVSWTNNSQMGFSNSENDPVMNQISDALRRLRTMDREINQNISSVNSSISSLERSRRQERDDAIRRASEQLVLLRARYPRNPQESTESNRSQSRTSAPSSSRSTRNLPTTPRTRNRTVRINSRTSNTSPSLRRSSSRSSLNRSSSSSRLRTSSSSSNLRRSNSRSRLNRSSSSARLRTSSSSSNLRRSSSRSGLNRSSSSTRLRSSNSINRNGRMTNSASSTNLLSRPAWNSSAPTPPPRISRNSSIFRVRRGSESSTPTQSTPVRSSSRTARTRTRLRTNQQNTSHSRNRVVRVPSRRTFTPANRTPVPSSARVVNVSPIRARHLAPPSIDIVPTSTSSILRPPSGPLPSPRSREDLTELNRRNSLNFLRSFNRITDEQWNAPRWTVLERQTRDRFNRPEETEFSNDVLNERHTRRAVELSLLTAQNQLPSKFHVLNLPSRKELQETQINYAHLGKVVSNDILPEAPSDATLDDFIDILTISQAFASLPIVIEDEGELITRRPFIINTLDRVHDLLDFQAPQNSSPENRAKIKQKLHIQKMMKHIIDALKKENIRIEGLSQSEKRQAKVDFTEKMKTFFQDLGHAALHCNDRIKQECELMVGDLFSDYSPSTETLEDKILRKIQVFRNNVFKEAVILSCRNLNEVDISSTIEYYQDKLKDEFGLASSTGTEWSHLIHPNLSEKIRKNFYKMYTPKSLVNAIKESCQFGELFKWFEERYDVQGLGFEVSNENCDNLKDEALLFILHKLKIVL